MTDAMRVRVKRVALVATCALTLACVYGLVGCLRHPLFFHRFSTAEEAIKGLDAFWRRNYDTSLDVCPPYELKYSFNCDDNVIVFYSYHYRLDDNECALDYAVGVLKRHHDGTLSFVNGFAWLRLSEPKSTVDLDYLFRSSTNIRTDEGKRLICLLYLERDSDKDIYVDGIKAERIPVSIDGREFDICYVLTRPYDVFAVLLSPEDHFQHTIEIR